MATKCEKRHRQTLALRSGDLEATCDNLGLERDYIEYFINALAS